MTVLKINEATKIIIGWSEVACHLGVAGEALEVVPLPNGMAQIFKDGKEFSFPVTWSEAGIYQDHEGNPYVP
jgi:hypothetical protein